MQRFAFLFPVLIGFATLTGCGEVQQIEQPPGITSSVEPASTANTAPASPTGPSTHILTGPVVKIADGDTLTVLGPDRTQHRVRLEGIDAPERRQAFGTRSREALGEKVFRKTVRIDWNERDRYDRILGHVFLDDRWINREMVEEGWAWHYRQYSDDEKLAAAERQARENRRGLWADPSPIPPWEFRRTPSAGDGGASGGGGDGIGAGATAEANQPGERNGQPADEITVYVTRTGEKYHRASCRYLRKSRIPMPLGKAKRRYSPCSVCRPPQ